MLSGLTSIPKTQTVRTARKGIDTIIYLKQTITTAAMIADSMSSLATVHKSQLVDLENTAFNVIENIQRVKPESFTHESSTRENSINLPSSKQSFILLNTIHEILIHDELQSEISHIIGELISESTAFSKSSHEMKHQECFAIRSGRSGELDVARKTYLQSVEDIYSVWSLMRNKLDGNNCFYSN